MCDCIKKMKEEWKAKGMYDIQFDNIYGTSKVTIPFSYHTKNEKTGVLTKKSWKGHFIPKYCPFCGVQLREDD